MKHSPPEYIATGAVLLIKKAVRLLLNQALLILSFLVPKRKGMVVAGSGLGMRFMGNPKYVYLQLLDPQTASAAGLDVVWITENERLFVQMSGRGWPVLRKFSLRGFWALLRAEFLVMESGMRVAEVTHDLAYAWLFYGRFRVIQTWHGSPMKHICLDALRDRGLNTLLARTFFAATQIEYRRLDCVIAQSGYDRAILAGTFANDNVPILGSARNDVFSKSLPLIEDVQSRLRLANFDRVIVYAPTYREARARLLGSQMFRHREAPVRPFSDDFLTRLDGLLAARNWLLVVKKHHLDHALQVPAGLDYVVEATGVDDVQELLVHAHTLITDYSSICFDFLAAGRPIIYYMYDLVQYQAEVGNLYLDFEQDIVGPFARDESDLERLLLDADQWFAGQGYLAAFQQFQARFQTHHHGGATERLIEYMRLRSAGRSRQEAARLAESHLPVQAVSMQAGGE